MRAAARCSVFAVTLWAGVPQAPALTDEPAAEAAPAAENTHAPAERSPIERAPVADGADTDTDSNAGGDIQPGVLYTTRSAEGIAYRWRLGEGTPLGETTDAVVIFGGMAIGDSFEAALLDELHEPLVLIPEGVTHEEEPIEVSPTDISEEAADRLIAAMEADERGEPGAQTPPPGFACDMRDALAVRSYLLEMGRTFGVRRFYLVGFGEGAGFATLFAGRFPALADAMVLVDAKRCELADLGEHGRGGGGGVVHVPIVFIDTRPEGDAPAASADTALLAAMYRLNTHEMVRVQRLEPAANEEAGARDAANAAFVAEAITWSDAMTAWGEDAPARVLGGAEGLAGGEDGGRWLGAARQALARLVETPGTSQDEPGFESFGMAMTTPGEALEDVPDDTRAKAAAMIARIDEQALRHVWTLRGERRSVDTLVLDGSAWLGHVAAVREAYRGVPLVERYVHESGYAALVERHDAAVDALWEAWAAASVDDGEPEGSRDARLFAEAVRLLGDCYASDFLPADLLPRLEGIYARRDALELSEEALEQYERVRLFAASMEAGRARAALIDKTWDAARPIAGLVRDDENIWPINDDPAAQAEPPTEAAINEEPADDHDEAPHEEPGLKW